MMGEGQRKEKIVLVKLQPLAYNKEQGFTASWAKVKGVNYVVWKMLLELNVTVTCWKREKQEIIYVFVIHYKVISTPTAKPTCLSAVCSSVWHLVLNASKHIDS